MFEKEPNSHNEFNVTVSMRQLSLLVAGLLAFCFVVFITGYFLGQKNAAQEFSYKADQDSLADQIYSSMCVLYDAKDESEEINESPDEGESTDLAYGMDQKDESETAPETVAQSISQKSYTATIAGFSARQKSDGANLASRLTSNGYPCELIEHKSMKKGKSVTWYQVVTKPYSSPEALQKIKPSLAKIAHVQEKSISIH